MSQINLDVKLIGCFYRSDEADASVDVECGDQSTRLGREGESI